jgi:NagD protein
MPKSYLIDMDGVIVRGNELVPGADAFLQRLHERQIKFLILTNNPQYTPVDLQYRLASIGVNLTADHIYTSALATAQFLKWQQPNGTAFAIGEVGLTEALHSVGYVLTERNPDFVVLGETTSYSYGRITQAVRLIREGARFIATNPDITGPTKRGPVPACGALVAPIEKVTGISPYFLGKPNPAMMYWARKKLRVHSANCFMIGDRMDTDILGGLEAGMTCCLVLSGVTSLKMLHRFPYQPDYVFESVADIDPRTILSRRERVAQ